MIWFPGVKFRLTHTGRDAWCCMAAAGPATRERKVTYPISPDRYAMAGRFVPARRSQFDAVTYSTSTPRFKLDKACVRPRETFGAA
jgi:hypothetical protein